LGAVTWATENNVAAVWMNRVQNVAKIVSCNVHTSQCSEVSFLSCLSMLENYLLVFGTCHAIAQAVTCCFSSCKYGFIPKAAHVGFVVDKEALEQVFLST